MRGRTVAPPAAPEPKTAPALAERSPHPARPADGPERPAARSRTAQPIVTQQAAGAERGLAPLASRVPDGAVAKTGLLGPAAPVLRHVAAPSTAPGVPNERPAGGSRTARASTPAPSSQVAEPVGRLLGHVPTALLAAAPRSRPDPATAAAVSRLTGVAVERATVRRGAGVGDAARALGAAAFTYDGVVHLPDRHGPAGTPEARTLLAHELTHVAQHVRATLDPAHRPPLRPREDVEAEAREVARRVARSTPAAPPTTLPATLATDPAPSRPEPPARADTSHVRRHTEAPTRGQAGDAVPDDATLDRQARLLYPRVRALLDADLARDRQRTGQQG
jgi:hypothetical protein